MTNLWASWQFEDIFLMDIDVKSEKWIRFKQRLEEEETQVKTEFPPDQLEAMRELVNQKEESKDI